MANSVQNTAVAGSSALGIVSGLFNTLNSGLSAVYNKHQQERANQYQIEAEQRQNQYNIEAEQRSLQYQKDLIDYTNEYNSPANQKERLAEAGYNPYLVDVESGQMQQPNSVGADAATAQSAYQPDMKETLGLDKFADGALEGLKYSLEKKKLQFEGEKIDFAKRQFEKQMSLAEREFTHKKQMELDEFAYRKTLDDINTSLRKREISLKEAQEARAAAHEKFEEARETAHDEMALARHGLDMKIDALAYQKDHEEYLELFPEMKRNKKLKLELENMVNDLSDEDKKIYVAAVRKTELLRLKMLDNDISYADYMRDAYKVWDDANTKSSFFKKGDERQYEKTRYWVGRDYEVNPYSGRGQADNPFMKWAKNFQQ